MNKAKFFYKKTLYLNEQSYDGLVRQLADWFEPLTHLSLKCLSMLN
jgi:hypothetical protein